jgi:hypothetical protein
MVGLDDMRGFLAASICSLNKNKLNGLLAKIDSRRFLLSEGFGHRVSAEGGLLAVQVPAILHIKPLLRFQLQSRWAI